MDERKRYCEICGAAIVTDSIYCTRCDIAFEQIPLPVSQPPKQKTSRNWLIALVVVLLVVGVIYGIALVGYFATSAGNTGNSYYNSFSAQRWTIIGAFLGVSLGVICIFLIPGKKTYGGIQEEKGGRS